MERDGDYQTCESGVFVAGDAGRGQSLIVWAIAEGRAAAASVDRYLEGETELPSPVRPTDRGIDHLSLSTYDNTSLHTKEPMRRAKIVATLGPATASYDNIRAIIEAGVDVARMNLSHGSYEVHEEVYQNVRQAADDAAKAVAVLVDLQGPKIRLARFANGPHELAVGDIFTITTEDVEGTKDICGTTFKGLPQDVAAG